MNPALQELLAAGTPTKEALESFFEGREFPLVDNGSVTFVYHGKADAVHLRHWIFGLASNEPFHRVEGSDLWHFTMELPERSRVEYKIERVRGDRHKWIMDPLNPHHARDPYGANSVCFGGGYEMPDWAMESSEARPGSIETHRLSSAVFNDHRELNVYLPARFRRRRRYPLLVVHDGGDYLRFAALKTVLDNLIHRLEIAPMIVALIDSPDRLTEYGADPRHGDFVAQEVVPTIEQLYPVVRRPDARALMGASFGAVATLATAWKHPGTFGGLLLQSGSFAFSDIGEHGRGPAFDPVAEFVNRFRAEPGRPADRVFMSCGTYESLIYENRSLVPVLQKTQMDLRYVEARDGHNWENWRDRLREGLSWLFPGPLWMVYE